MSKKLPDPAAADRLDALVKAALKSGADAADAVEFKNISVGVSYRLGRLEDVGRAESSDLGLRVFIGKQVAFVSSTDFSEAALAVLPERAVERKRDRDPASEQVRQLVQQARCAQCAFDRS
jgi:PmbA protein